MNRKELIAKVAEATESTKTATEVFVNAYENAIREIISTGEPVELYNFMKIAIKEVKARNGVNPRTKEPIVIPAHKAIKIKPLKGLKDCAGE